MYISGYGNTASSVYVRVREVSTTVFVRIWYLDMMVYMGMGMGIMVYIRVLEVTIVV